MQLFTRPSQFSQVLGMANCPNFQHWITYYICKTKAELGSGIKLNKHFFLVELIVWAPLWKLRWTIITRIIVFNWINNIDTKMHVLHTIIIPEFINLLLYDVLKSKNFSFVKSKDAYYHWHPSVKSWQNIMNFQQNIWQCSHPHDGCLRLSYPSWHWTWEENENYSSVDIEIYNNAFVVVIYFIIFRQCASCINTICQCIQT